VSSAPQLGLRPNLAQFSLLVVINAFVGGMVGMERSVLPLLAEAEFGLSAQSAILSFIAVFGLTKALTNYAAGRGADRWGRKPLLLVGWAVAAPVPFLLMGAPTWGWILVANALLGVSQGLTWSTTVIMKIDLAGPARRGLAMGLNEFAGYLAVALSALATGYLAATLGLRPYPFWLGVAFVLLGGGLSVFALRETHGHAAHEARGRPAEAPPSSEAAPSSGAALSAASQAGFVNNLNDGVAWGLFPGLFAAAGLSLAEIGALAALYPAVWGVGQLAAGAGSDRLGRRVFIVGGMAVQAVGLGVVALGADFATFAAGAALLGVGTAAVYPTLLATVGDAAHPSRRASAVGVYRLWRDLGYVAGALVGGAVADALGLEVAILAVAGLTLASGLAAGLRLRGGPALAANLAPRPAEPLAPGIRAP
jgi:MFS family permease